MMKIVIFEAEPWESKAFEGLAEVHEIIAEAKPLTPGTVEELDYEAIGDAEIVSTFIYSELGCEVLQRFPNLKLLATRSTGFEHIDLDYCKENGIQVTNVPTYGENTVAEHVFALLLAISHHLIEAVDRTRRGDFSQQGLRGFDLQGKTMGIVGAGNIGRYAARLAKGFGMQVLAFDVEPDQDAARDIGFDYVEMTELLHRADVVSLHVPGTKKTRNMISDDEFKLMKDGVVLINTARGAVVDSRALLHALSLGKVAAVGLDVLPEEPILREEAELLRSAYSKEHDLEALLADHILLRLRNVIITPHSAFNTDEAVQRIVDTTRANIEAFLSGEPQNVVA